MLCRRTRRGEPADACSDRRSQLVAFPVGRTRGAPGVNLLGSRRLGSRRLGDCGGARRRIRNDRFRVDPRDAVAPGPGKVGGPLPSQNPPAFEAGSEHVGRGSHAKGPCVMLLIKSGPESRRRRSGLGRGAFAGSGSGSGERSPGPDRGMRRGLDPSRRPRRRSS
jgi:hypothetical protein